MRICVVMVFLFLRSLGSSVASMSTLVTGNYSLTFPFNVPNDQWSYYEYEVTKTWKNAKSNDIDIQCNGNF